MEAKRISDITERLNKNADLFRFPRWEDFPDVDLYMDQVTEFINRYQSGFESFGLKMPDITPSMINNYVKSKLMPPPVKKRYSRLHLAYIVIICTLKQTFSIPVIALILPGDADGDTMRMFYNTFAQYQESAYSGALGDISALNKGGTVPAVMNCLADVNVRKVLTENIAADVFGAEND